MTPIRGSPRAQSPSRGDRAIEQGPGVDPGPRCDGGPQGNFLGALSVLPGHPNGPGIRRVDDDVDDLQKKMEKKSVN